MLPIMLPCKLMFKSLFSFYFEALLYVLLSTAVVSSSFLFSSENIDDFECKNMFSCYCC